MATDAEVRSLRDRVHKLNDLVQAHEGKLREHTVLLDVYGRGIETLRETTASREQLESASNAMTETLGHFHKENGLKFEGFDTRFKTLHDDLGDIKNGINWVVKLVIAAVILAVLGLVLQGAKKKGDVGVLAPSAIEAHA